MTALTTDEVSAAVAEGDSWCRCGYLKSRHVNGRSPSPKCDRFERSNSFNDDEWLRSKKGAKK